MKVRLIDICQPKQWQTISTDMLLQNGYPVYGANGIIGYYDKYNHTKPTLMITCRGATCGTINISKPFSYINGNAMCLDNLSENVLINYLYYQLSNYDFDKVISGSAQPQITREGLGKVWLELHLIEEQRIIANNLEKIDYLINKRKQQLEKLDLLVKSKFIEMFGDPVDNSKKWIKEKLEGRCGIVTGNTPSRADEDNYGEYIEWIKSDNINTPNIYLTKAQEYLSEKGFAKCRYVETGALLMTCIAGSISCIGNVAVSNRRVSFNQQINAIIPHKNKDNVLFLYWLMLLSKPYIQGAINKSLIRNTK